MLKNVIFIICSFYLYVSSALPSNNCPANAAPDTIVLPPNKDVVKITRTWELPSILKEISGIDFMDSIHIACIQDEVGSIFVFNIKTNSIEKEIPFGPPGDYEAIAVLKEDAYVACADGRLYEILNYNTTPVIKEYGTHLTVKQNPEGLCIDSKNKRLLVAIKGKENDNQMYKGIYAFDLVTKKMAIKPVYKIDLLNPLFGKQSLKRALSAIQPSDITIHPQTGEMYITDAARPQMIVLTNEGEIRNVFPLNKEQFIQPEGITFNAQGDMYISSEGNKHQPAKLMLVELKN